jgi:hypothetical protein
MKRLIRKILREEIEKSDRHYRMLDNISDHVHLPYFESMGGLTIYDKDDQEYIMRKILGNGISIKYGEVFGLDDIELMINDNNGNKLYYESCCRRGYWQKWRYDDNGNLIGEIWGIKMSISGENNFK